MLTHEDAAAFDGAANAIDEALKSTERVPSSRETSIVLTKLEEAELWLQKSRQKREHEMRNRKLSLTELAEAVVNFERNPEKESASMAPTRRSPSRPL